MIRKGVFRIDEFCTGTPFFCETVKAVCALEMGHRHITFYSYKPQILGNSYTAFVYAVLPHRAADLLASE